MNVVREFEICFMLRRETHKPLEARIGKMKANVRRFTKESPAGPEHARAGSQYFQRIREMLNDVPKCYDVIRIRRKFRGFYEPLLKPGAMAHRGPVHDFGRDIEAVRKD